MKKTLLLILDGWGHAIDKNGSAIDQAGDLFFHKLIQQYPHANLTTFGTEVGLPEGQMGNSEVGHLNIGAGRIVYQEFQRINVAIESNELKQNKALNTSFEYCKKNNKPLHIMGLYSDGGVHSHTNHFKAIIQYAEEYGLSTILVHAFTDGRDCDPKSGKNLLVDLKEFLDNKKTKLASICGRYYAMDRDQRWERVKKAYNLLVRGEGEEIVSLTEAIQSQYDQNITDEFLLPMKTPDFQKIIEQDAVLCVNFRTDRCREITEVLTQKAFPEFQMNPLKLHYTTMTNYNKNFLDISCIFHQDNLTNTLGEVLQSHQIKQLRIAETEKYPHVTFFFSGGRELVFEGEERIMAASPKVATYDLKPEMAAYEIKTNLIKSIEEKDFGSIIVNFANTDMVGHTGVFSAAVKAVKAVDTCLKEIVPIAIKNEFQIIIIADHGNSDYMINPDGSPNTAHSMNLVPIIVISPDVKSVKDGKLADVAPTLLHLMDIEIPKEMTGTVLTN